ncbi:MAG: transposase [Verrucomicrobiales bacterium]
MERNVPESFTVFSLPEAKRRKCLCTSNMIENLNMQIRRRTRVARIFPNEGAACAWSAPLSWRSPRREAGKVYLAPKHLH